MKNNEDGIEKLRKLMKKGEFKEVFDELLKIYGNKGTDLQMLQYSFESIKKKFKLKKITHKEYNPHEARIIKILTETIDSLETERKFTILNSREDRTMKIIEDLKELKIKDLLLKEESKTKIWSVAFLSIFALGDENTYASFIKETLKEEDFEKQKEQFLILSEEKKSLLQLAACGHEIRCIICPANAKNISENIKDAVYRTTQLINFLKNDTGDSFIERALKHIHWVIAEYPQRNVYILGDISIYEGFKKGHERFGYGLSTRQTFKEVISSNSQLYEVFFEGLSFRNSIDADPEWQKRILSIRKEARRVEYRREYVIFKLEKSLEFLNKIVKERA